MNARIVIRTKIQIHTLCTSQTSEKNIIILTIFGTITPVTMMTQITHKVVLINTLKLERKLKGKWQYSEMSQICIKIYENVKF